MNKNLINVILENLDNKTIAKNILPINNELFRSCALKRLKYYSGEWNTLHPSDGKGEFIDLEQNNLYEGRWDNLKGGVMIYNLDDENVIFVGKWNHDCTINTGYGRFSSENRLYDGRWQDNFFFGKITSYSSNYKQKFTFGINKEFNGIGSLVFDENVYTGKWKSNKGEGHIKYKNPLDNQEYVFTGSFQHFNPINGQGEFIQDDNIYIGKWENGIGQGEIKPLNNQNISWQGKWDQFLWPIEGKGTITFSNKYLYEGNWVEGYGEGIVRTGEDFIYKGTWNKYGHMFNGEGYFLNSDQNLFHGVWIEGQGDGEIVFSNGQSIKAKWDGFRRITEGNGVYYDNDNRMYVGSIKDGNGVGKIVSLNAFVYEGSWDVDGIPIDGEGLFVHHGVFYSGKWKDGKGNGEIFS